MFEQLLKYPIDIFRQGDFYFGIRLPGLILFLIFVGLIAASIWAYRTTQGRTHRGIPGLSHLPPRPRALWAGILSAQAVCDHLPNKPGRFLPRSTIGRIEKYASDRLRESGIPSEQRKQSALCP